MADHLYKINKLQRVDMIEMGLNPLNPDHVSKYLSGGAIRPQVQENIDRMKALMGDKLNADLGHGRHADMDPMHGQEYTPGMGQAPAARQPQDFRRQLSEDMDSYADQPSAGQAGGFRPLNQPQQQKAPQQLNEVQQAGQKMAMDYYNAFIASLQNPSTAANLAVHKALTALLKQEQQLKESRPKALPQFQQAVRNATTKMYNHLKG